MRGSNQANGARAPLRKNFRDWILRYIRNAAADCNERTDTAMAEIAALTIERARVQPGETVLKRPHCHSGFRRRVGETIVLLPEQGSWIRCKAALRRNLGNALSSFSRRGGDTIERAVGPDNSGGAIDSFWFLTMTTQGWRSCC